MFFNAILIKSFFGLIGIALNYVFHFFQTVFTPWRWSCTGGRSRSMQHNMAASEHPWSCTCPRHTEQRHLWSCPQTWGSWARRSDQWTICKSSCYCSSQACSHRQTQSFIGIIFKCMNSLPYLSNGCLTMLYRILFCDLSLKENLMKWSKCSHLSSIITFTWQGWEFLAGNALLSTCKCCPTCQHIWLS